MNKHTYIYNIKLWIEHNVHLTYVQQISFRDFVQFDQDTMAVSTASSRAGNFSSFAEAGAEAGASGSSFSSSSENEAAAQLVRGTHWKLPLSIKKLDSTYHLVMTNSLPWKDPPFFIDKPSINGPFSMAMLNNQRVKHKVSPSSGGHVTFWMIFTVDL